MPGTLELQLKGNVAYHRILHYGREGNKVIQNYSLKTYLKERVKILFQFSLKFMQTT